MIHSETSFSAKSDRAYVHGQQMDNVLDHQNPLFWRLNTLTVGLYRPTCSCSVNAPTWACTVSQYFVHVDYSADSTRSLIVNA